MQPNIDSSLHFGSKTSASRQNVSNFSRKNSSGNNQGKDHGNSNGIGNGRGRRGTQCQFCQKIRHIASSCYTFKKFIRGSMPTR